MNLETALTFNPFTTNIDHTSPSQESGAWGGTSWCAVASNSQQLVTSGPETHRKLTIPAKNLVRLRSRIGQSGTQGTDKSHAAIQYQVACRVTNIWSDQVSNRPGSTRLGSRGLPWLGSRDCVGSRRLGSDRLGREARRGSAREGLEKI